MDSPSAKLIDEESAHAFVTGFVAVLPSSQGLGIFDLRRGSSHLATSSQAIGMLGDNLHLSSALVAVYLATGQDIACLAENAIAFSQASPDGGDGLLVRMTLSSLTMGTVGGGTRLPAQRRKPELIGCGDRLHDSRKLAEIIAAALELSVLAAVVSGKFAQAPEKYGLARGKQDR